MAADKGGRVGRKKKSHFGISKFPRFGIPKCYIHYGGSSQALPYLGRIVAAKSPD
jgi:hypothetical protein